MFWLTHNPLKSPWSGHRHVRHVSALKVQLNGGQGHLYILIDHSGQPAWRCERIEAQHEVRDAPGE